MLDVRGSGSTSKVEVAGIRLKKPGEDGKGVLVEVDLDESIQSEAEAAAVDMVVPGGARLWRASSLAQQAGEVASEVAGAAAGAEAASGANGPFGQYTIKPPDNALRLTLGAGDEVISAPFECQAVRVRSTPKDCRYVVKGRLLGLTRDQIGLLASWLTTTQPATLIAAQGDLPFRRDDSIKLGAIVSGHANGQEYAGIVVSLSEDRAQIEISDCGDNLLVPAATVAGSFEVLGEGDQEIAMLISAYGRLAKKAKVIPTWRALVAALGRVYLSGDDVPDGPWQLTAAIIDDAIEAQRGTRSDGEQPAAH